MVVETFRDLSDDELNRIEHRIEAASSGPWFSYVVGRDAGVTSNYIELGLCNELGSCETIELTGGSIADQDFIASAREDLPRLLFEVRILRARLDALRVPHREPQREPQTIRGAVDAPAPLLTVSKDRKDRSEIDQRL